MIGDTALILDTNGRPVPGLAPAAKEGGQHAARAIRMGLRGKDPGPFRHRRCGNLAALGRRSAIIEFGRLRLHGFVAWVLWSVAHIFFLIGFRNRMAVSLEWIWPCLSYRGGARLITGERRG